MDAPATSHLETEQKYDADPGFVMPDFSTLPGYSVSAPERYQLSATYFDTDDLRLAANKVTLRRRTGGTDAAWHLKLPLRPGTRREEHVPLTEGTDTVPRQLEAMVTDITGGKPLRPIALLETDRTVRRLAGSGGEVLAEVADDAVTARRLGRERQDDPMKWHEIEVELVSGGPDVLEAAGQLLRKAGARPSASASKLGRLLAEG